MAVCLGDTNASVRMLAAEALSEMRDGVLVDPCVVPSLVRALQNLDDKARPFAADDWCLNLNEPLRRGAREWTARRPGVEVPKATGRPNANRPDPGPSRPDRIRDARQRIPHYGEPLGA